MNPFSQRRGIKPVRSVIQVDNIDQELRNRLWNALDIYYWEEAHSEKSMKNDVYNHEYMVLATRLWHHYFKKPIDTIPYNWNGTREHLRKYFFACLWYEVYDFIEFVANNFQVEKANEGFVASCNRILQSELSGYRFIDNLIVPITSEEEIDEIEKALNSTKPFQPVSVHLRNALDKLSDRESPDYRNSIKESISAVEAMCRLIAGSSATLGKTLGEIRKQKKVHLHGALEEAFDKLYGYTSDEGGIRHSLLEESELDFEDAKFMLVSCSAFVNYLKVKASKSGIQLEKK